MPTDQPTTRSNATIGTNARPTSVMLNANSPSATSPTTVTPIASFASPNSTTPAAYSPSRNGVTSRFSRLRDHVSSMKPVARLISAWNTTWKSRIPARRKPAPLAPAPDWRAK